MIRLNSHWEREWQEIIYHLEFQCISLRKSIIILLILIRSFQIKKLPFCEKWKYQSFDIIKYLLNSLFEVVNISDKSFVLQKNSRNIFDDILLIFWWCTTASLVTPKQDIIFWRKVTRFFRTIQKNHQFFFLNFMLFYQKLNPNPNKWIAQK
jgi:hypothetical protein